MENVVFLTLAYFGSLFFIFIVIDILLNSMLNWIKPKFN